MVGKRGFNFREQSAPLIWSWRFLWLILLTCDVFFFFLLLLFFFIFFYFFIFLFVRSVLSLVSMYASFQCKTELLNLNKFEMLEVLPCRVV
jgi:hypothetical protein